MNKETLKTPLKITGKGDSLWGPSEGEFIVDSYQVRELNYLEDESIEAPYELQVFGENTDWWQYTDSQIEEEVERDFIPILEELYPQFKFTSICWSEQGMQPDSGWSFDIIIEE